MSLSVPFSISSGSEEFERLNPGGILLISVSSSLSLNAEIDFDLSPTGACNIPEVILLPFWTGMGESLLRGIKGTVPSCSGAGGGKDTGDVGFPGSTCDSGCSSLSFLIATKFSSSAFAWDVTLGGLLLRSIELSLRTPQIVLERLESRLSKVSIPVSFVRLVPS